MEVVAGSEVDGLADEPLGSPTLSDKVDVEALKQEMKDDDSLKTCRELADKCKLGYRWSDGLLYNDVVDDDGKVVARLVLPKLRRNKVLTLAHENGGHVGCKKMRQVIGLRFTWPGVGVDVVQWARSCETCGRINKAGHKKAQMQERPIVSVPFETVAIDIVDIQLATLHSVWDMSQ